MTATMIAWFVAVILNAQATPRCEPFASRFTQFVACERAEGTLHAFSDRHVVWRVRFFIRYWEMPCGEFPTRQEAYVFHLVTDDLYGDRDLNDSQRVAIREAMYRGTPHCGGEPGANPLQSSRTRRARAASSLRRDSMAGF